MPEGLTIRAAVCPSLPVIRSVRHLERPYNVKEPPLHHILIAVQRPVVGVVDRPGPSLDGRTVFLGLYDEAAAH